MFDLLRAAGFLYLVFSFLLAIIFFSKAEVNFILLITVPLGIVFQGLMILLVCFALSKIIDELDKMKGEG